MIKTFSLAKLPEGSAAPTFLRESLKVEVAALFELGYPAVGFLLQHEYTMSGLVPEVSRAAPNPSLVLQEIRAAQHVS